MTTLHLGVVDLPYNNATPAPRRIGTRKNKDGSLAEFSAPGSGQQTTGDVAEYLEAKYHILELFLAEYGHRIEAAVENSMQGALENIIAGAPVATEGASSLYAPAADELSAAMKYFIESAELEELGIPGVPTKAALMGVNHRLKIRRGARRPSFRDTGTYEAALKAWFDSGSSGG